MMNIQVQKLHDTKSIACIQQQQQNTSMLTPQVISWLKGQIYTVRKDLKSQKE